MSELSNISINGCLEKKQMMNIDKLELIDFLISEIDDLEPKNVHYEYYYKDLCKDNIEQNYRNSFIKNIIGLPKETLIDYMIKHYFYYLKK